MTLNHKVRGSSPLQGLLFFGIFFLVNLIVKKYANYNRFIGITVIDRKLFVIVNDFNAMLLKK